MKCSRCGCTNQQCGQEHKMVETPMEIKQTVEIEKLLLKSRISKKLREQLKELIASYRLVKGK